MDPRYSRIEHPSSQPRPQSTASSEMTVITSQPWALTRNTEHSQHWEMFQPRTDADAERIQLPPLKQVESPVLRGDVNMFTNLYIGFSRP